MMLSTEKAEAIFESAGHGDAFYSNSEYKEDVFGTTKEENQQALERLRNAFFSYLTLSPDSEMLLSLEKDRVCEACWVGNHCDQEGLNNRGGDRQDIFNLADWFRLCRALTATGYQIMEDEKDKPISREDFGQILARISSLVGEFQIVYSHRDDLDSFALKTKFKNLMRDDIRIISGVEIRSFRNYWETLLKLKGIELKTMIEHKIWKLEGIPKFI